MCMAELFEPPSFYYESRPKARTAHRCVDCLRRIPVGERYHREACKYNHVVAWKTCQQCYAAREYLQHVCGGYAYGGLAEDLRTHAEESGSIAVWRLFALLLCGWERRHQRVPVSRVRQLVSSAIADAVVGA